MSGEPGLVSVVIATHDRRPLLEEAIASVVAQDDHPWELLVVDDASSDDTREFLGGLSDPRIRTLAPPEHGGRAAACGLGLEQARGAFVLFLDDDDRLRPHALSLLVGALLSDPEAVAAVGARYRFQGDRGAAIPHPATPMRLRVEEELLCGWSSVSGQNLYRTEVVRRLGGYDARFWPADDRDLWLRVAALGPVRTRPEIVLEYRAHASQSDKRGIEAIRAAVYQRYIETLAPPERRRARRIQKSGEDRWTAQQSLQRGRRAAAMIYLLRSIVRRPAVVRSPLLGKVTQEVFWNSLPPPLVRLLSRVRRKVRGR